MIFEMPKMGGTSRACGGEKFQTGGKGVNASRAACLWGAKSAAAVFYAGDSGKRCLLSLSSEKFDGRKIKIIGEKISGRTREGLVCIDSKSGIETSFLGCDNPVEEKSLNNILEKIKSLAKEGDIFAFCGSFPGWKTSFAEKIFRLCKNKKMLFCLDTYGEPLKDFLEVFKKHGEKIQFLKINKNEFLALVEKSSAKKIHHSYEEIFKVFAASAPVENFIVSNSKKDVFCFCKGSFFKLSPPKISKEISATACGDSMTAIFACEVFIANTEAKTAAKIATVFASKAAQSRDIPGVSKNALEKIRKAEMAPYKKTK